MRFQNAIHGPYKQFLGFVVGHLAGNVLDRDSDEGLAAVWARFAVVIVGGWAGYAAHIHVFWGNGDEENDDIEGGEAGRGI